MCAYAFVCVNLVSHLLMTDLVNLVLWISALSLTSHSTLKVSRSSPPLQEGTQMDIRRRLSDNWLGGEVLQTTAMNLAITSHSTDRHSLFINSCLNSFFLHVFYLRSSSVFFAKLYPVA